MQKYSVFDFLIGLGNYFDTHKDFHKHSVHDIYDMLDQFAYNFYQDDFILKQLIAIDYCLQSKVKPKSRYIQEVDQTKRIFIIDSLKLNHHKYRYVILPISFDFEEFITSENIAQLDSYVIIQYSGVDMPIVIYNSAPIIV
jgi:hypothetical protein